MTYSIGDLEHPVEDDPRFEDREKAEETARKNSIDDSPWGIWDDETGELLAIAYSLILYYP